MNLRRPIRENETILINYLLRHVQLDPAQFRIADLVEEYEGGKMGSIYLGGDSDAYAGDLVQVEYVDVDNTPVVITLTMDSHNQLLDLDFWKIDFSKLIEYPVPEKIIFSKTAADDESV